MGRQMTKSCRSTFIVIGWRIRSFLDLVLFRYVAPPLQLGHIRYGVYGFLATCR
jgi:hypothetical protein